MDFILIMENQWTIFVISLLVTIFTWKVATPGHEETNAEEPQTKTTSDIDAYPAQS